MKSGIKLTVFGGASEIGGNQVLLEDIGYDVKLFLDFGMNFDKYFKAFDFESPATIDELMKVKLMPDKKEIPVENLYSEHFLFNHNNQTVRQKIEECKGKVDPPSDLDGILISHAHRDHYYGLPLINRNVPIYTGVVTKKIIMAYYNSSRIQMDSFFHNLNWKLFRTGDVIEIKNMKIMPIHVDHSIPAAYGFIIDTSAGVLIYSGDFRMHGPFSSMTLDLIREVKKYLQKNNKNETISKNCEERAKVLICEGTHINKGAIESEKLVKRQLKKLMHGNPFDYILVKYDRVDWDRFRTYVEIAKRFNWKYIISEREAYFYYLLNKRAKYNTMRNPNIKKDDHIFILSEGPARYAWMRKIRQILNKYDKEWRYLRIEELKDIGGKFILFITSLYDRLVENLPLNLNGVFISSSIDPYVEEFLDNNKTIMYKLLKLGIPSYRIHASGHAKPHDIIRFCDAIHPEHLIPIHTEYPELFSKFFEKSDIKVVLPKYNESINID